MFDLPTILAIALVFLISSTIQCAVGFAFGLFAMPLLLWLEIPLPLAIALSNGGSFTQSFAATWKLRDHVDWPDVFRATVGRTIFIPAGVWLMFILTQELTIAQIKQVVGLILLLIVLLQWRARSQPRPRLAWPWGLLAYSASGIASGLCGMGGPGIVLYAHAHDWNPHRIRVYLYANVVLTLPVTLLMLCLAGRSTPGMTASDVLLAFALGVMLLPAVLLGMWPGMWVGHRMSRPRLKRTAFAVLAVLAVASVVSPYLAKSAASAPTPVQAAALPVGEHQPITRR